MLIKLAFSPCLSVRVGSGEDWDKQRKHMTFELEVPLYSDLFCLLEYDTGIKYSNFWMEARNLIFKQNLPTFEHWLGLEKYTNNAGQQNISVG